jgi:hypothetical protein
MRCREVRTRSSQQLAVIYNVQDHPNYTHSRSASHLSEFPLFILLHAIQLFVLREVVELLVPWLGNLVHGF